MNKPTSSLAALAALSLVLPAAQPAHAQADSNEVKPLIAQVAKAYKGISAYSATVETTQGGGNKMVSKLILKKPNLLSATVTRGADTKKIVADGKSYYVSTSTDAKKYIKAPAADLTTTVNVLAQNGGAGVGLLPILLLGENVEQQIVPGKPKSVKKIADTTVDGVACDSVQAVLVGGDQEFRYTFAFGKVDHLLRKLAIGPNKDGAEPAVSETHTAVSVTPATTASTFTFTPPAGAVAADPPKAPSMFDERLKPGVEPFALKGNDLDGKPVSYGEYKGKVLLVDFWATWCGPCVAELPNVIDAYKKYHDKGFEVLGISLDRADSRDKLTSFMKEHSMPWRQIYDGKFWEAENAVAYGVHGIPFTVLVGKDGKIAAIGARGDKLAPAIEAALAK